MKVQNEKQQKLTCRLSPSCLAYNDGTIYVGTKCGSILVLDSRTLKLQKTVYPRRRDDPHPIPPENIRQRFSREYNYGHDSAVLNLSISRGAN